MYIIHRLTVAYPLSWLETSDAPQGAADQATRLLPLWVAPITDGVLQRARRRRAAATREYRPGAGSIRWTGAGEPQFRALFRVWQHLLVECHRGRVQRGGVSALSRRQRARSLGIPVPQWRRSIQDLWQFPHQRALRQCARRASRQREIWRDQVPGLV